MSTGNFVKVWCQYIKERGDDLASRPDECKAILKEGYKSTFQDTNRWSRCRDKICEHYPENRNLKSNNPSHGVTVPTNQ